MALVPCESCRRHVRAGDAACPFCKTVRTATTVVAVAAAALTIAGCEAFSPASKYGGPPAPYVAPDAETTTTTTTLTSDAAAPAPSPTPAASSPRLTAPTSDTTTHAPVAMYGGPPRH